MNEPDKRTHFINELMDLNETAVLAMTQDRLNAGEDPLDILEDAREGVRLVGLRYEERQYYVSGLMMAGEIFREVMELVEPIMVKRLNGNISGTVLLGTVQGDIHDIGKNVFRTMLRSHGFTVVDLGVDVPPERFVEEAIRMHPDIIALSGLLTVSFETMKATVESIRQASDPIAARAPFIIGGGTINAMVCAYAKAEYWATDALFGVQLCQQIIAEGW